jgi:arsenate reductase
MNVQIFGRRDSSDSRKAERWFKERRIPFQFVDLKVKGLSPRELETVAHAIGWDHLLDRDSKRFLEKGLAFMTPSRLPKILEEDALLLLTPIVRNGREATLGMKPEIWLTWK